LLWCANKRGPRTKRSLFHRAQKATHPEAPKKKEGSSILPAREILIPADRHMNLYAGKTVPRRPNAMRAPSGKPALERRIGDLPPLGAGTATRDEAILGRQRSLMAIED